MKRNYIHQYPSGQAHRVGRIEMAARGGPARQRFFDMAQPGGRLGHDPGWVVDVVSSWDKLRFDSLAASHFVECSIHLGECEAAGNERVAV
jgi:hypothetical protein